MTYRELRLWQRRMGFSPDAAARALGMNPAAYEEMVRETGADLRTVDRRTALACSALAAGLKEWRCGTIEGVYSAP